jgi:hypothetical protein
MKTMRARVMLAHPVLYAATRPENTLWKIEREVAGIVLRFSEVSTCFFKVSRCQPVLG